MEPKQLPVSASLGAMGSLAGKLDALQDVDLKVKIWKLTNWLLLLSTERDPPVAARVWMKDVRELSYDMENSVDVSETDWIGSMPGFKARAEVAIERYHRYKLGSTHNFTNTAANFKIPVVDGQRWPDLAVVGLHDEGGAVDRLIQLLTDDCKTEPKVVSIVGVGGIGKTTLAKELWREKKLGRFQCRAFVRTAKKADMGRILRSILAQVRPHQPPDSDEVHELIHDVRTHLQGKRYFIIIDDVWATSVWDVARRAFPESNGSKIITTTEIKDVSLACCSYQPENIYKIKPLTVSQAQKLFISRVFGSGEEKSRQLDGVSGEMITEEKSLQLDVGPEEIVIEEKSHNLDEVSEEIITEEKSHKLNEVSEEIIIEEKSRKFDKMSDEIITRCAGLPLAIISISSVLASQKEANTIHNWVEVNSPINTTPVEVLKQVLNICYNCLPSYLQTCLLYLSVYPENYMILKEDIMKQWVAEGFIVAPTENDKMKVAGNYFDKLVSMGLIQHIDVGYSNEVHYYAVHHMVHDLITSKSKEENFTTVIDYSERTVGISNKVSRLSLQFGSATYATIPESIGLSQVRSLAFIGLKSCYSSILEFKVLRFLILHVWVDQPRTGLDLKPTSELVVLKSLQVTCNDTVHLPDLMQGPKQLETLEINARVAAIPAKIVHLRSWLHLRLGVGTELTDLTGILKNDTLKPSIALDGSSSPPNSVTTLELLSPICGVPKWIGQLTNLCILKFVLGELQSDDIHNLQGLPLLTVLSLDVQRPTRGPIGFAPGLFNALEYFEFRCGVLRLAFEKGAMRNLQRLRLGFNAHRGEQYDDWLHGIEHLSNVKEISGIIGVGTGADKRDLDNAQSAFRKAVGKHGRRIVRLKRADMVEELYLPEEKQHEIQGEQPSTSSSQRVGSPKLGSQDVHGPLETQHEIPEKKPTTSNGQHGSPTQESPDVCGPPEKQHEISEEQPSTSSEQPARTNQDYQKEIKQDSGSDYQFINRMPSPGAPSKNMYSKQQQPAATPQKNEFTSKKERSITDLVVGMAKAVVDGALTKAQEAIAEEAKLRQRAQRNLVFITDEFQMMQSCLKDIAGSERLENPAVRTWVWQIRELAYNVEDCIEFVGHLDKKNRWWLRLLKPMNLLTPCIHVALPLDVAVDELDQLKARVEEVSSRNARYSLIISQSGFKPVAAEAQPASHDSVGMTALNRLIEAANTNKEEIIHLLPKKDQDLGVISIWGTGGGDVGMASIAWNAFTDDETCKNFVCRAWVKLMHPFDPREFVQSLTAQFYANSYCKEGRMMSVDGVHALMKMEEATRGGDPLKDFERLVMENRYLVVLEDLSTVADWAAIRRFFPNIKNGSCVILSTQQFEVASLSVGRPFKVLHLNELQAENSVYVFFTEESWYDGDKGMERNSGVSSGNCKKEAAKRWIDQHPLVGRELEMMDLGLKVIVARAKGYQVMSVWGFAGVGKSALVKNMFCEKILKGKLFQKYGWVDIPHPFNLRDFSQTLLWNFGSEYLQDSERAASLCSMGSRNPIAECRQILKEHRCLVVIDALQSKEDWDLIKDDLVYGSHRQNVVIVVTTEQEIATHCRGDKGESLVFNVKGLEANTAIELFEKVSNKGEVGEIRELTSICGGLPKVIVEIAGTFAKNTDRWKDAPSTNNNFMLELENNGEFVGLRGLFDWMNSSFRNCPDSLKACILYLPVFPRNYLIRRRRLIRRWIAEGYSRDNHEESAEMTGEKQFQDLLDLRIIQQPSMMGLGDTRCQVNGFFREYIVSHQTEETLVFELTGSCVVSTQRTGRHLVISETWVRDQTVFKNIDFSRLRSLTVFGKWESYFISESMKLLRVLDLEDASEVVYSDLKKMVKMHHKVTEVAVHPRGHHRPSKQFADKTPFIVPAVQSPPSWYCGASRDRKTDRVAEA